MAAFFTQDTHPLLTALYQGDVQRVHQLLPSVDVEEQHAFEIEHEPTISRIPMHATPLEFVMQLFAQDAPISSQQIQQWKASLNAVLEYNEVVVGERSLRAAVRMMEHRRIGAKDAADVLQTLDSKMAYFAAPIFEFKKETYLDAVARHLPGALPKLRNSQFVIRKMGVDTAKLLSQGVEWSSGRDGYLPWFAWHPVKINGERKLLETIERKRNIDAGVDLDTMYSYRAAPEPKLSQSPINPLRARKAFV